LHQILQIVMGWTNSHLHQFELKTEVEVTNLEELEEALEAWVHVTMLDNMAPEEMHRAVKPVDCRAVLEASGWVTLETVRAIAETGVDLEG